MDTAWNGGATREPRETMCARKIVPPGIKQFARFIEDEHIVFGLVSEQHDAALLILHKLVAIVHRVDVWISLSPFVIHTVAHVAMPVDRIITFRE